MTYSFTYILTVSTVPTVHRSGGSQEHTGQVRSQVRGSRKPQVRSRSQVQVSGHDTCERFQGFLPQPDEFYFTTDEKKILENCRCIVPNFINDKFI
jgi:hypothetical protein